MRSRQSIRPRLDRSREDALDSMEDSSAACYDDMESKTAKLLSLVKLIDDSDVMPVHVDEEDSAVHSIEVARVVLRSEV